MTVRAWGVRWCDGVGGGSGTTRASLPSCNHPFHKARVCCPRALAQPLPAHPASRPATMTDLLVRLKSLKSSKQARSRGLGKGLGRDALRRARLATRLPPPPPQAKTAVIQTPVDDMEASVRAGRSLLRLASARAAAPAGVAAAVERSAASSPAAATHEAAGGRGLGGLGAGTRVHGALAGPGTPAAPNPKQAGACVA